MAERGRDTNRIGRRTLLLGAAGAAAGSAVAASVAAVGLGGIVDGATVGDVARRVMVPRPAGGYDPNALYVALYGFPGSRTLGVLGEQGVVATADRAAGVAAGYAGFAQRVVPTFEIIGSVASSSAGADGDYSNEFGVERFRPYIDIAAERGYYVVFDLQSGRSRFPDQVREYADHLDFPHVGLALDPEWRGDAPFRPGGGRIGTLDAVEVNETVAWLDAFITERRLPPKLLVLHQFTPSMLTNKQLIRGTPNVQVLLHMDGFGTLGMKQNSWRLMVDDLPPGARTGWKNFYDEDRPTPTPAQTMANSPTPQFVSYQ